MENIVNLYQSFSKEIETHIVEKLALDDKADIDKLFNLAVEELIDGYRIVCSNEAMDFLKKHDMSLARQ